MTSDVRRALPALVVALGFVLPLALGACSGDDERNDRAGATTTIALTPPRPVGARTARVRGVDLAASETLGVALHPGSAITLTATTEDDLEVCQATTDTDLDPSFGSWPGDAFDTCIQFDDGRAVVPATPTDSYHVGFAVRGPAGTKPAAIDELTIEYEAVDGFFLVGMPPLDRGERTPTIVVVPERATTVEAAVYGPRYTATDALRLAVRVDRAEVPATGGEPTSEFGSPYGPVAPGAEVSLRATASAPVERPLLTVVWS